VNCHDANKLIFQTLVNGISGNRLQQLPKLMRTQKKQNIEMKEIIEPKDITILGTLVNGVTGI
jgi:hypothetical protein